MPCQNMKACQKQYNTFSAAASVAPIVLWSGHSRGVSNNVYLATKNTFLEFYTDEKKAVMRTAAARSSSCDSRFTAEPNSAKSTRANTRSPSPSNRSLESNDGNVMQSPGLLESTDTSPCAANYPYPDAKFYYDASDVNYYSGHGNSESGYQHYSNQGVCQGAYQTEPQGAYQTQLQGGFQTEPQGGYPVVAPPMMPASMMPSVNEYEWQLPPWASSTEALSWTPTEAPAWKVPETHTWTPTEASPWTRKVDESALLRCPAPLPASTLARTTSRSKYVVDSVKPGTGSAVDLMEPGTKSESLVAKKQPIVEPNADQPVDEITTLMIRGIPCSFSQDAIMRSIDQAGLRGKYDFFYLPKANSNGSNLGYAFVNFTNQATAEQCMATFNGVPLDPSRSTKICTISQADVQGLANLRKHFRKTAVARGSRGPVFLKVFTEEESRQ